MVNLEDKIGKFTIETKICENQREYLDICKYEDRLLNCGYYLDGTCVYSHSNPQPAIVLKNYYERFKK